MRKLTFKYTFTDTNSTTRLIKWDGPKNFLKEKLPFEAFYE